jgi:hypothetical protein
VPEPERLRDRAANLKGKADALLRKPMLYLLKQRHWRRLRLENKNRQFQAEPLPRPLVAPLRFAD